MKIYTDSSRCIGTGLCESIAEDVFEMSEDGVVHVLQEDVSEDRRAEMNEAVEMCPARALSIRN